MGTATTVLVMLAKVGVEMEVQLLGKSGHWGLNMHTQRTTAVISGAWQMANATWHMGIFLQGSLYRTRPEERTAQVHRHSQF